MSEKNPRSQYLRTIKLGPALGDWTQISADFPDDNFSEISSINSTNFDKLSKTDLQTTHYLHHYLAFLIAKHVSKDMNIKIDLHTVCVTQIQYSDFIESMSDQIFQTDITFPNQGIINLIFGNNLASMMVDRLTGGKGVSQDKTTFNELEMTLLSEQLQHIVGLFPKIWGKGLDIADAKLDVYSGSYRPDHRISYRETYIVYTFYMYFGDGELLRFIVAYPNQIMRDFLELYNNTPRSISPEITLSQNNLESIHYEVKAELGAAELTVEELESLEVGDIVTLNSTVDHLIPLTIGGNVKLFAQPCIHNNRLGCQIVWDNQESIPITLMPLHEDLGQAEPHNHDVSIHTNKANEDNNTEQQLDISNEYESEESEEELANHVPEELKDEYVPIENEPEETLDFDERSEDPTQVEDNDEALELEDVEEQEQEQENEDDDFDWDELDDDDI